MDEYKTHEAKLLPCPFCGGDQIRILPQAYGAKATTPALMTSCYGYSVDCQTCKARHDVVTDHPDQVVATWNQRRPTYLSCEARRLIEIKWVERRLTGEDRSDDAAMREIVKLLEQLASQQGRADRFDG